MQRKTERKVRHWEGKGPTFPGWVDSLVGWVDSEIPQNINLYMREVTATKAKKEGGDSRQGAKRRVEIL